MDILLINHYAGSCRHGMEYRPYYMAREWTKLGHQVTIAAASFSHVRTVAPSMRGELTEEEIEGIRYLWLKTPEYHGNGARRGVNMLAFIAQLLKNHARLTNGKRQDVVIASSTYPLDILPAHRIARSCRARLIFEVHDLWPLSPIELAGMSPRHPFIRLLQWTENYAYRHSDRVVSMLPNAAGHMRAHGMRDEKFCYLPNGIDVAEWEGETPELPAEHRALLTGLREKYGVLVGYAGAHGLANALDALLDAAATLRSQSVAFVLVGQGPEKEDLQQKASDLGLANVFFLPAVPKRAVPALLSAMDMLYIGLKRASLFRFGISPNKLMDYMMAARPVIQAIEAGNDMVAESGCGISVPPEDPAAIARAIVQLASLSPGERDAMGRAGREYIRAHHDLQVLSQRFLALMQ
jgi:glycosyltransferase involved in cell wall biosynthesis